MFCIRGAGFSVDKLDFEEFVKKSRNIRKNGSSITKISKFWKNSQ